MNNQLQNSPYFFQLKKKNWACISGFPSSEENHFWQTFVHLAYALRHRVFGCLKSRSEAKRLAFFSRASASVVGGICAAFGLEKNDASPTACFDLDSHPAWRAKQRYLDNL
jgi:hypothetical protein